MYILIDLERSFHGGRLVFWKDRSTGYTPDISDAGEYDGLNARRIVDSDFDHYTLMIPASVARKLTNTLNPL